MLVFTNISRVGCGSYIDAGANKGDWARLFLECKLNIKKLLNIDPQAAHQPSLGNLSKANFNVVIEQDAVEVSLGHLTL